MLQDKSVNPLLMIPVSLSQLYILVLYYYYNDQKSALHCVSVVTRSESILLMCTKAIWKSQSDVNYTFLRALAAS